MLLFLADYLTQIFSGFNAFTYITLRAIMGALTALIMSFVLLLIILVLASVLRIVFQLTEVLP